MIQWSLALNTLSCGSSPSSFAARLRALDKAYPGADALQNLSEEATEAWDSPLQ